VNYYYDTSALCRHYHAETGSDRVEALFEEDGARHVISRLTYVECHSAFALKVRTGQITGDDFALLRRRLRADVHRRSLVVARTLRLHFDLAESLLVKYSLTQRLRTLDALHLAIALDLRAKGSIDTLVSADAVLVSLARSEGLAVINPLDPQLRQ